VAEASAVDIALQVASAIGEAHSQGVIHRDIKPENIMVSPRGVKVLDFGIAREMTSHANGSMTQAGIVLGTPHYMSPEQAQGFPLNGRSDIFSLGAVLYEMLSGTKPFVGETAIGVLLQVATYRHAPLWNVGPELAAIVDRCLEKKPAKRFQTASELVDALSQWARRIAPAPSASTTPTLMLQSAGAATHPSAQRVLVADDDLVARQMLRTALERLGYEVDEAVDGSDAIRRLKSDLYAVLITDLLMPRLDGWAVLDFLRFYPARRPGRILVSSTMGDIKLSEADRQIVNAIVSKPVTMAQLSQGLRAMSSV
jgi:CheY-like chemotaxis protein